METIAGARLSGNKSGRQRNDRLFTGNLDPNSPVEAEQNVSHRRDETIHRISAAAV
ncbi:hypothetical protein [Sphingomonas koreensis]|jgi:hypothetical protein|uniref:hypothetical protein n=1 Tax=Sphingomonas koreensis TaxID=93064 RepID=UPI0013DD9E78|nr:hypothetical protein [Sphingomonas koreensis]MDC7812548.1 hypothetical protein [Sphingomonas koreensis]